MIFYLRGHGLINPILQLLICLYPDEEHTRGEDGASPRGEYVVSTLSEHDGRLRAEAEGYWGDSVSLTLPEGLGRDDHDVAEYLRRAMYLLLVKRLEKAPDWVETTYSPLGDAPSSPDVYKRQL